MSDTNVNNATVTPDLLPLVSPYGYTPSRSIAITFIILFSITTVIHFVQAAKFRRWWPLWTVCLCGVMEVVGWSGRLWSTFSLYILPPFQMQITLCIIAPTPLLAANFIILGEIIKYLGPSYSRLSPRMYSIIFCTCDVLSLFIQAGGAGMAAAADTPEGAQSGSNMMLFGIIFQLFVIVMFSLSGVEFFTRYVYDRPFTSKSVIKVWEKKSLYLLTSGRRTAITQKTKIMAAALLFNTTMLFIRAIYRTCELAGGWDGPIMSNELLFNVLDGAMVVLAIYTLNFVHPVRFLEQVTNPNDSEQKLEQFNSV